MTGNQSITDKEKRKRRGVLNFMGELCKISFGTKDESDARYYNQQINLLVFEQNAEDKPL
jgi:hypothetical protein